MNAYDFAGLVAGLAGVWLFLASAVIAALATLRLAAVRRRPGKGRISRGALAFAAVVGAAGLALFVAAELTPFRRSLDRHAGALVAAIAGAGLAAGWRAGRRRAGSPDASRVAVPCGTVTPPPGSAAPSSPGPAAPGAGPTT